MCILHHYHLLLLKREASPIDNSVMQFFRHFIFLQKINGQLHTVSLGYIHPPRLLVHILHFGNERGKYDGTQEHSDDEEQLLAGIVSRNISCRYTLLSEFRVHCTQLSFKQHIRNKD